MECNWSNKMLLLLCLQFLTDHFFLASPAFVCKSKDRNGDNNIYLLNTTDFLGSVLPLLHLLPGLLHLSVQSILWKLRNIFIRRKYKLRIIFIIGGEFKYLTGLAHRYKMRFSEKNIKYRMDTH
ncbi:hypothetical protein H5410_047594, partial [Solanum commersonii]